MAMWFSERLSKIADEVKSGKRPRATVRELLRWWGSQRRGWRVVTDIRAQLQRHGISTNPDFEYPHIDATITFVDGASHDDAEVLLNSEKSPESAETLPVSESVSTVLSQTTNQPFGAQDPTYRVNSLSAANRTPTSVAPDTSIKEAVTIMLLNDFSQVPVLTTERDVKGMFSWRSLATRIGLGKECSRVGDCMDPHRDVFDDVPLFEAVQAILDAECVIVRDRSRRVCGLITASDLALQFHQLGEPFLLTGEIEKQLRLIVANKLTSDQLGEQKDPGDPERGIETPADLTFGELVRLFENPEHWEQIGLTIDRKVVVDQLARIRDIRNDIMHFSLDEVPDCDLESLRGFVRFLHRVREYTSARR